jgi:NAD(P)-dependent dehydrogenase (short-subunit alcohol dehydrogenase family)
MGGTGLLEGQVALITGAGNGIGREVALQMAAEGASIVVNDLGTSTRGEGKDAGPAEAVVAEITRRGGKAVANTGSVTEWDAAAGMVQQAIESFGRIDIVVNNAGTVRFSPFEEMTLDDFDSLVKVHLYGSFHVARAAAGYFKDQNSGCYVHMTSTAGLIGNRGNANYASAKLGVAALSKSIAFDMARYGVTSNCIAPSAVSRMSQGVDDERRAKFGTNDYSVQLTSRQGAPEQVAPFVVFLASAPGRGISGQIFGVRGNEIYLYSQPRPVRTLHRNGGWTPTTLAEQLIPAWQSSLVPLETYQQVFSWPPVS